MSSEFEKFWRSVAGDHGVKFGMIAEIMADPELVESLTAAIDRLERQESIGPILDPSAWLGNAGARSRLCRDLLQAAIAFGRAEQERRAKWDGR